MDGLSRTQVMALSAAFVLAIVGVIVVQRSDAKVGDTIGFIGVLAGVWIAALTNLDSDAS
ncbi:hypothetical protein KV097_12850 [Mumia sp. zg.B17]|uniref:hypothetical protein n=1 Tax=Mumia sp. zg.B17 TaxID=2855446 RepID=UPI001C6F044C|nr:hypothetical protein [Mumia sp. zg.B17]MBW9206830.1 hypothetical protein [Mumia sp. zg.B17]